MTNVNLAMHVVKAQLSMFCCRKLKINHEKENKRLFLDYFGEEISRREQHAPPRTSAGFGVKNHGEGRLQRSKDSEKKLTEDQLMFLRRKQVSLVILRIVLQQEVLRNEYRFHS